MRSKFSSAPTMPSQPDSKFPEFMTAAEVASILRLAPATVRAMIHSGEIPAKRFGKCYRIDRKAFEQWMSSR